MRGNTSTVRKTGDDEQIVIGLVLYLLASIRETKSFGATSKFYSVM